MITKLSGRSTKLTFVVIFGLFVLPGCGEDDSQKHLFKIKLRDDIGIFTTDLIFQNKAMAEENVDAVITVYRNDGTVETFKRFWAIWTYDEEKIVNIKSGKHDMIRLDISTIHFKWRQEYTSR